MSYSVTNPKVISTGKIKKTVQERKVKTKHKRVRTLTCMIQRFADNCIVTDA